MNNYKEPLVSYLVLDFKREPETRICLESIRRHTKFDHKIIYLHNGGDEDYPFALLKEGLIDQLIQPQVNGGLGLGTRDLFAACFSEYSIYFQNDQYLLRDFTEEELKQIIGVLGSQYEDQTIVSVSLAGSPCGKNIYSERAHIIRTKQYKHLEFSGFLGYYGAGPHHDGVWREEQIQKMYRDNKGIHFEWPQLLVGDNGGESVRQNPDGSLWKHFTDTKQLWLIKGPVKEKHIYPNLTDEEWSHVLSNQSWHEGKIPENEIKNSFHVWH